MKQGHGVDGERNVSKMDGKIGSHIKVLSANCQGLRDLKKRADVINYLDSLGGNILCLQETHWTKNDLSTIKNLWKGDCFLGGTKTNSNGVAILIKSNFEYEVVEHFIDNEGKIIWLNILINKKLKVKLINIYAPNKDTPDFFKKIGNIIESSNMDYVMLAGDFNITLDPKLDSYNYKQLNNPCARNEMLSVINKYNLCDIFRLNHPNEKRYTWRRKNPLKQARLDYFIISRPFSDLVSDCPIRASYRSDHSILELNITICSFQQGKGVWKFNNSLLKDKDYLIKINNVIDEEKMRYAVPIYNPNNITKVKDTELQLTISDSQFFEVLLLKIRGETIKFSSLKKQSVNSKELNLIKEIDSIEQEEVPDLELLGKKKKEIEDLRGEKIKGSIIRSRVKWLTDGEKPSKYFCMLENHRYIEKTIKHLKNEKNENIYEQDNILKEIHKFYSNLFNKKENKYAKDFFKKISPNSYNRLSKLESDALEGKLTEDEISQSLQNMKHNKSPGIDGFPSEFYKVFWRKLKFFVLRTLNESYNIGQLPVTMRHSIISCLPKGDKPREYLKNWRPISLLSVAYKIGSAAIANRLNKVLTHLIPEQQTGFIRGRYMSDCTRLIYDTMHFTEYNKIPGLIMLVDFEKAFDSVSWDFLIEALNKLGFGQNFIKWINTLNTNIFATVLQCGFLSNKICIKRGCRQGDPIAPYLFIICSLFLTTLVETCGSIKGLNINKEYLKIIQFADDTTIFLDGSETSLQSALNVLEIFGTYSGLKVNKEKTQIVWIGSKKGNTQKICQHANLKWEANTFRVLGITFSVNLNDMPSLNYDTITVEVERTLVPWRQRKLTPIGKICILKTFIIPRLTTLFMTIPRPSPRTIKLLNKLFYSFIWDYKPDKISRAKLTQGYPKGGLKMTDVDAFITSLKISWIKRLLSNDTPVWKTLGLHCIKNPIRLKYLGST